MNFHTARVIWTHSTTRLLLQNAQARDIPLIYEGGIIFLANTVSQNPGIWNHQGCLYVGTH